ncbi:cupin domain-containing protein [Flavobacterium amnicola]|uniref:Cupin domain-containing protein n=1 Tax=Flavobacterium amnicola TaxID=2506422 RepID=A0A4Q1K1S7_9FLAO|nr:cupin domain-containing protein [Flavobacterium amnicola]RXR18257.1 cupin domain-containing protein [Flavobacterium amnicola]
MKDLNLKEWNDDAFIVPLHNNEQFQCYGNKLKIIIPTTLTNNQFGLYEIEMEANARGPKLHYHKQMDETFIIEEGTLTVLTGNGEVQAEAGTVIHIPRLSVHGYNNNSDGIVKMKMIFNPGFGREDFFRKMYQMLEENPDDLSAFQKLYLENDSFTLDEKNMIPMRDKNKNCL